MSNKVKIGLLAILLIGLGAIWTTVYFTKQISANGDYVCYTSSSDCSQCTWGSWNEATHSRQCTATAYYIQHWGNTRTQCTKQDWAFGYEPWGGFRYGTQVLYSLACPIKTQTDTAVPTCNTKEENGKFYLQCVPNGAAPCMNYQSWTEVPYAEPGESKIVGIGTAAGIYEGCIIPEQPE